MGYTLTVEELIMRTIGLISVHLCLQRSGWFKFKVLSLPKPTAKVSKEPCNHLALSRCPN